jgi:2-methylcitrate dehydratase PrpD
MAYAAREGFHGSENSPDGAWIAAALGLDFNADELTTDLGARSVFPELSLKPYATARQALGATEAMRGLTGDGLDPAQIEKVIVRVPTSHRNMISQSLNPQARGTAFVSGPCQVATAALAPAALWDVERRDVLANAAIAALAARVEIIGDEKLDADFPRVWAAEVEAIADGRTYSRVIRNAPGSPDARMTETDILEKARRALAFFGEAERAERIIGLGQTMFASDATAAELANIFLHG